MKTCKFCNEAKPISAFCNNKTKKDGKNIYCRVCAEKKRRAWRKTNKDRANELARNYRNKNKEKVNTSNKNWRDKNKEKLAQQRKLTRLKNPEYFLYKSAKERAKRKNIPFSISVEDIIIPKVCPYLGIDLHISNKNMTDFSPTLDRVNPALGYVRGNVVVVSWRANRIKSDGTAAELRAIADAIEDHH